MLMPQMNNGLLNGFYYAIGLSHPVIPEILDNTIPCTHQPTGALNTAQDTFFISQYAPKLIVNLSSTKSHAHPCSSISSIAIQWPYIGMQIGCKHITSLSGYSEQWAVGSWECPECPE